MYFSIFLFAVKWLFPEFPEVPELPDLPELPEFPELPDLPEVPDLLEFPDQSPQSSKTNGLRASGERGVTVTFSNFTRSAWRT